MTEYIDFSKFKIEHYVSTFQGDYLKYMSEYNSTGREKYKCLNFTSINPRFPYDIRIFIQQSGDSINIEVICENVCKNLDVHDEVMEAVIQEIDQVIKLVKVKLQDYMSNLEYFGEACSISIDTLVVDKNELMKLTPQVVNQLYTSLKPVEIEYSNCTNRLFLYTSKGYEAARMLQELNIADYIRTRSGYYIVFREKQALLTNEFIDKFAREIRNFGIPALSGSNEYLDYAW